MVVLFIQGENKFFLSLGGLHLIHFDERFLDSEKKTRNVLPFGVCVHNFDQKERYILIYKLPYRKFYIVYTFRMSIFKFLKSSQKNRDKYCKKLTIRLLFRLLNGFKQI